MPAEPGALATILVVDATPTNIDLLQEALSPLYRVKVATSGRRALEIASQNAALNGLVEDFNGICSDAVEYLESLKNSKDKFDIINIDPPGLIKSRKDFHAGYKLYRKINSLALDLLEPGGILASSSCSHNLGREDFRKMLAEAAGKSGKNARLLEQRLQSRDHPVLVSMPETEYLKFAVLQVI